MYVYNNKEKNISLLNQYMLARTLSMFEYTNLPDTIPAVALEKLLQTTGYTFITDVAGRLYAFVGGLGGEPDAYGEPTKITINNPALQFSDTLDIEKDGVLIKNDDMMLGLIPLYEKYNTLIIENEITMFLASYNSRMQSLISAGDDTTKESAELYLKKVVAGELGIIGENRLFEGIKTQNTQGNAVNYTQLIEFNQYLKASLFNEIGVNMNPNMKRERLIASEVEMNTDNLHTLISNMLENRKRGIERLNEMYGLDIGVKYGSIWKVRRQEVEPTTEEQEPEEPEEVKGQEEQEPEEPEEVKGQEEQEPEDPEEVKGQEEQEPEEVEGQEEQEPSIENNINISINIDHEPEEEPEEVEQKSPTVEIEVNAETGKEDEEEKGKDGEDA